MDRPVANLGSCRKVLDIERHRCRAVIPAGVPRRTEPAGGRVGTNIMKISAPLVPLALILPAAPAWACTLCHSRTAEEVRAAIFGADFLSNVVALALPVPVLVAAVLAARKYLL
jgi:hypothetical protein